MSKIELIGLEKSFGERKLFQIENLKIEENEKVGIIGQNGCGKTTLLNIIAGIVKPDKGQVIVKDEVSYIKQFEDIDKNMSGGEKTKYIINRKLKFYSPILLVDEPTNHLDIDSINEVERKLNKYNGTLILISHDRKILEKICTSIIEIEDGNVYKYKGNYSNYRQQKDAKKKREEFEYSQYVKQKEALEKSINISKNKSTSVKKTPSRMGNSEARLHKRESQEIKQKLDSHTQALMSRLQNLDKKDKPKKQVEISMNHFKTPKIEAKNAITVQNLHVNYGKKEIFNNLTFYMPANKKIALIGPNGSGKTTLIKTILQNDNPNIKINNQARIGYFSQELKTLDFSKTVLENVLENSIQNEIVVKNILARLLFVKKDLDKKVNILSGGEKVKVAICKLLVSNSNLLILDEPTNFLDINSLEALERLFKEFDNTILFTSHDRDFIDKVANCLLIIKNKQIEFFDGNYTDYSNYTNRKKVNSNNLLLEIKISRILSELSTVNDEKQKEILEKELSDLQKKLGN